MSETSKSVKVMLMHLNEIIRHLTKLSKHNGVNAQGKLLKRIKIKTVFDEEMRDFLSRYFRSGKKLSWLNDVCLVSFQLRGEEREIILHSSKGRVSGIDISSFPLQRELDLDWREVLGKKRELDTSQEAFQTPQKKVRSDDCITLSPPIKEVTQDDTSSSKLAYLASFGFKLSNLLQTALTKSIDSAIKKRELYIENAQFNPSNRMNKITAMKHSLRDASRQRLEAVDLIQKIMLDTTYGDDPDTGEDHPLLKYVLGRNDDDHQLSPFQLQKKASLTLEEIGRRSHWLCGKAERTEANPLGEGSLC